MSRDSTMALRVFKAILQETHLPLKFRSCVAPRLQLTAPSADLTSILASLVAIVPSTTVLTAIVIP